MVVFFTGAALPTRFDPLTWHIHAMLFGFVLAAIAGFMLTAIPNWTGRPPIRGAALASLLALWLFGRVARLVSAFLQFWLAAGLDLAFPVVLCAVAAREIVAAHNWRNLMMPLPIGVLAIANLLMYLELAQFNVPTGLGWRLAIAAIIAFVSAIGGRIIPAFTRNWLVKRQTSPRVLTHMVGSIAPRSQHSIPAFLAGRSFPTHDWSARCCSWVPRSISGVWPAGGGRRPYTNRCWRFCM